MENHLIYMDGCCHIAEIKEIRYFSKEYRMYFFMNCIYIYKYDMNVY